MENLLPPDVVAFDGSPVSPAAKRALSVALSECLDRSAYFEHRHLCESPIECVAFAALLASIPRVAVAEKSSLLGEGWHIGIIPQMQRFGYRLDFGVIVRASRHIFALECDGRYFHADRHRDCVRTADLWEQGIVVDRVSGSALCRNPIVAVASFVRRVLRDDYAAALAP